MDIIFFPIALKFEEPANLAITGCVSDSNDNDKQLDPYRPKN